MQCPQTGSRASLLDVSDLRAEDGSSLSMACYMCWVAELQGVFAVPDLYDAVLLSLLWGERYLGLEGNTQRRGIYGEFDAG
jgi:hypothetical protein